MVMNLHASILLTSTLLSALLASAAPVAAVDTSVASVAPDAGEGRPSVVVTTEVLGSVVAELAGDVADVTVLMAGGVDPHSWQPSARDSHALFEADLIVANGLDLEEGLVSVLEQAAEAGVPIFRATDHIAVRASAGPEAAHEGDDSGLEPTHEHAVGDPHFWLDPLAMRDVVLALGPVLAEAGLDVGERAASLARGLEALDAEIAQALAGIPQERRQLVTGHLALGYFADRYGFRVIGTVVPGLSTSDEPSARDISLLIESIREAGSTAVFSDVGTPSSVAEAVAAETGARLVTLQIAQIPESGAYADLLRGVATSVAEALAG
jgi:zinc/manganese transport system substrate-binding protein